MEKVSVIIPIYNDEKYLEQCLDSVIKQTYKNLEIILVDDGSTDRTPEICEQYRENDSRIRVLHKKNGGVGSSRNAGLAMATGDYVLFVDDDDFIYPEETETLYKLLKKNDADVAVGNFQDYIVKDNVYRYWLNDSQYFEKNYSIQDWFQFEYYKSDYFNMTEVFVVPWVKLYKRSLFEDVVYPVDKPIEDDLTIWKIYLLANKVAYVNKILSVHRVRGDSASLKSQDRSYLFPAEASIERLAILTMVGFDTTVEKDAVRWRLQVARDNALKSGDYLKHRNAIQLLKILDRYSK